MSYFASENITCSTDLSPEVLSQSILRGTGRRPVSARIANRSEDPDAVLLFRFGAAPAALAAFRLAVDETVEIIGFPNLLSLQLAALSADEGDVSAYVIFGD